MLRRAHGHRNHSHSQVNRHASLASSATRPANHTTKPANPAKKPAAPAEKPAAPAAEQLEILEQPVDLPTERSQTTASAYNIEPPPKPPPKPAAASTIVSDAKLDKAKEQITVAAARERYKKMGVAARDEMKRKFELVENEPPKDPKTKKTPVRGSLLTLSQTRPNFIRIVDEISKRTGVEAAIIIATIYPESRLKLKATSGNGEAIGLGQFQKASNEKGGGWAWNLVTKSQEYKKIWKELSNSDTPPVRGGSVWGDVLAVAMWYKLRGKETIEMRDPKTSKIKMLDLSTLACERSDMMKERVLRLLYKLSPALASKKIWQLVEENKLNPLEDQNNRTAFQVHISKIKEIRAKWPDMKKAAGIS